MGPSDYLITSILNFSCLPHTLCQREAQKEALCADPNFIQTKKLDFCSHGDKNRKPVLEWMGDLLVYADI